ncbi:uncharacterized protein LOC119332401 [Triticum dicoccoides]|uniref:uncharacterized protein LOC119332401 n=1 Tax=Triticum dicoccoides TaxID=85692 RepID=UPI0018914098|nr:uncharacterized protein LOC119332401 [Triticum dicoccoides]
MLEDAAGVGEESRGAAAGCGREDEKGVEGEVAAGALRKRGPGIGLLEEGRRRWQSAAGTPLKMDWCQVAAVASYPAGILVEECAGLVGAPYPADVLVGTSGLRC